MKLLDRTMVNLSSLSDPDVLGHISLYELSSGNYYYVYFVECKFYSAKEVDIKTDRVIKEESSDNDYHYSIDIFFNDKARYLGWNKMFALDFMKEDYKPILCP